MQVRIHRENLNDGYMITPNELFRGEGIYADLPPLARLMLGAGLSCKDEWDTTLDDIEEWLTDPEKGRPIGRDRQEAIRRMLREQGFLTMTPDRIPAGEPDGGQFRWVLAFYMYPLPEDRRDKLNEKKPRSSRDDSTEPGFSGHGDGDQETAGQTEPGFSGSRESGPGLPGPADPGALYKEEKNQGEKNPPLPPADTSPAVVPAARSGEGDRFDDETRNLLAAALEQASKLKPRWKVDDIRTAMVAAIDDDRKPADVARAIVELAEGKHGETRFPGRLRADGPWWVDTSGFPGPMRWLDKSTPRCAEHPSEPADICGRCTSVRRAVVPDYELARERVDVPADPAAARALIRQQVAAGAAKFRQPASRGASPSALDALRAATGDIEPPAAPVDEHQGAEPVRGLAELAEVAS